MSNRHRGGRGEVRCFPRGVGNLYDAAMISSLSDRCFPWLAALRLGGTEWIAVVAVIVVLASLLLVIVYHRLRTGAGLKWGAGTLKWCALALLSLCLLEPLWSTPRVQSGENSILVAVDTGGSLGIADGPNGGRRADQFLPFLPQESTWQQQLEKDFRVQRYAITGRVSGVGSLEGISFDGNGSSLNRGLEQFAERATSDSVAAIVLMTDGNATDFPDGWQRRAERSLTASSPTMSASAAQGVSSEFPTGLPPVFVVLPEVDEGAFDLAIEQVSVTQSSFEDAPVTILVTVRATGGALEAGGVKVRASLIRSGDMTPDEQIEMTSMVSSGNAREDKSGDRANGPSSHIATFRFQKSPTESVTFYRLNVSVVGDVDALPASVPVETTLANNERLVVVSRRPGPYRVLYVSGRPNWEFKFLRRAVNDDSDLGLVGLVRVARKEAKFDFRGRAGEAGSSLFRGFRDPVDEAAESYDEAVVIALGVKDADELPGGKFPVTLEALCQYDALIFDDIEAEFFTAAQVEMLDAFVSRRGGGFLMLGGVDSFHSGHWDKTRLQDILPVYSSRRTAFEEKVQTGGRDGNGQAPVATTTHWKLQLTRDGWLQPWVRLRSTDDAERLRVREMSPFQVVSQVPGIKPAAQVLSELVSGSGETAPALVAQNYGSGRSAVMLIGDLWRWGMFRAADAPDDLAKSWRQTVRWLVADVPRRVEASSELVNSGSTEVRRIQVQVRDPKFAPQDNAAVKVDILSPTDELLTLTADPSTDTPGLFEVDYVPRHDGVYIASVRATDADGTELGTAETGWTHEPLADEFRTSGVNREWVERLCSSTGGGIIRPDELEALAAGLPERESPRMEFAAVPLWHSPWMLAAILLCLLGEWGSRRWKGIP